MRHRVGGGSAHSPAILRVCPWCRSLAPNRFTADGGLLWCATPGCGWCGERADTARAGAAPADQAYLDFAAEYSPGDLDGLRRYRNWVPRAGPREPADWVAAGRP